MELLSKITKDTLAVLHRPVSSMETREYRRRTGISRWSLGFDKSPADMAVLAVVWVVFCIGLAVLMSLVPHWFILVMMISILAATSMIIFFRASGRAIRRHVRMADFASRCGLAYDPIGKTGAIGTGLVFDVGYSRHYRGVLSYEHAGQRLLEVGRYEYTVGSGKQRRTYTWHYAGVRLPRKVPHLVLDSKANDSTLMDRALISNLPVVISNSQRISLEGDFDRYFTLYAPKQYDVDVRYVLTPDVMAALVDKSPHFDVELVDDMVFFYILQNEILDHQVLGDIFTALAVVGRELHDQIDGYADDRVAGGRSSNTVAEQGRRLKKRIRPAILH